MKHYILSLMIVLASVVVAQETKKDDIQKQISELLVDTLPDKYKDVGLVLTTPVYYIPRVDTVVTMVLHKKLSKWHFHFVALSDFNILTDRYKVVDINGTKIALPRELIKTNKQKSASIFSVRF